MDGRVVHDARARASENSPWQRLVPLLNVEGFSVGGNAFTAGSLLRAGEDYEIFHISPRDSLRDQEVELSGVLDRIGVEVCYCSIYEDQCRSVYVGLRAAAGSRDGPVDVCARRD